MLKTRVIPSLLIKNEGLVKTVKFTNSKYVGDPINAIKIFNDKEVDELMLLDILASKQNRGPNFDLIKQISSECFMPLSYGGGIKNSDQAKKLFEIGIEKVEDVKAEDSSDDEEIIMDEPEGITEFCESKCDCMMCKTLNNIRNSWENFEPSSHLETLLKKYIDAMSEN